MVLFRSNTSFGCVGVTLVATVLYVDYKQGCIEHFYSQKDVVVMCCYFTYTGILEKTGGGGWGQHSG